MPGFLRPDLFSYTVGLCITKKSVLLVRITADTIAQEHALIDINKLHLIKDPFSDRCSSATIHKLVVPFLFFFIENGRKVFINRADINCCKISNDPTRLPESIRYGVPSEISFSIIGNRIIEPSKYSFAQTFHSAIAIEIVGTECWLLVIFPDHIKRMKVDDLAALLKSSPEISNVVYPLYHVLKNEKTKEIELCQSSHSYNALILMRLPLGCRGDYKITNSLSQNIHKLNTCNYQHIRDKKGARLSLSK